MGKFARVKVEEQLVPSIVTYTEPDEDAGVYVRPQRGPQTMFAVSEADIAILGGAAGGGKSYSLLLEPLRNVERTGKFAAVIFRRTTPSITHPGSLWDTASEIYSNFKKARRYD